MKNPCAKALRSIRLANGLTQSQLAEKLEVSNSHVGQIEQGKSFPSYELLFQITEMFDVDANLFFGGGNVQSVINTSFY